MGNEFNLSDATVAQAEAKLATAEGDLRSLIGATKTEALGRLTEGVKGPIHVACTNLIERWSAEVEQVTTILEEFKAKLGATSARAADDAQAQAASLAGIADNIAARMA